jgi:hypothetical protein
VQSCHHKIADNHTLDDGIAQLASQIDNPMSPPLVSSFGTFETGLDLASLAWPKLKHTFHNESGLRLLAHSTNALRQDGPIQRLKSTYLRDHPVDGLLVGKHGPQPEGDPVLNMIRLCSPELRPRLVVEFWAPNVIMYEDGPMSKGCRVNWEKTANYVSRCQRVRASEAGGMVDQDKLLII